MVLRVLLVTDWPLPPRGLGSINLATTILQTCQQLCIEGRPMLYKENTLCVNIDYGPHGSSGREQRCRVLNGEFWLPRNLFEVRGGTITDRRQWLMGILNGMLPEFDRFELHFQYPQRDQVFLTCYILRDLLLDRHVTINIERKNLDLTNLDEHDVDEHDDDEYDLTGCCYLRCNSVSLKGGEGQNLSYFEYLRSTCTSKTPVVDIFAEYMSLQDSIHDRLPGDFTDKLLELDAYLKAAVIEQNAEAFVERRVNFIKEARIFTKSWATERREAQLSIMKEEFEDIEKCANKALKRISRALGEAHEVYKLEPVHPMFWMED